MPTDPRPAPPPPVQRLRLRYARRGRLRYSSHRDFQRALERAIRRTGIPIAYSAGFSPHPKISYAGAAPTGAASEAEYLEIALTQELDPDRLRQELDDALPAGLDILQAVEASPGPLQDLLTGSVWQAVLPGVDEPALEAAVDLFLGCDQALVERVTKKGRRTMDARAAVVAMAVEPGSGDDQAPCAILRMVVRHTTPAVRPDDVLSAMRAVAGLAPGSAPQLTRLTQGPLDERTASVADPLATAGTPSHD